MNVSHLRQHLADLGRLMESGGAKAAAAELASLCDALAPFAESSLTAFAGSLAGRPAPEGRKRSGTKSAPKASIDIEPLAREVQHTYESASSPQVTPESIDALMLRLAPLAKDGLVTIAERIGLKGMGTRSKPAIQSAIRDRIEKRKGVIIRASMTDRL